MRDLMMLGAMMFIVPVALSNAFAAYLVWGWTSVISVPFYLYGFMGSLRYNLFFAVVTLTLVFLGKIKEKGSFSLNSTSLLIILFVAHGGICAVLAKPGATDNWSIYTDLIKSIVYCLTMFMFVNSRLRLHAMLVAIALGLGFHGSVEGLKTLASGGGHKVLGIPGSKMSDNNHFGVALVMALPILLYLYQYSKFRLVRYGFLGALGATVLAIVGSNSRGAFVAMAALALFLIMTTRRKITALLLVAIGVTIVLQVTPESWFDRIETIGDASSDGSFMGRVEAWNISTALAINNPFFGTGFHASQKADVWFTVQHRDGLFSTFAPNSGIVRAAHSIYFEVLGDLGFIGLFLFLGILLNAILTAIFVRRLAAKYGSSMLWAREMADALALSVCAFAVGGAAVSLAYFEVFYVVVVLLEVLKQTVRKMEREGLMVSRQEFATKNNAILTQ